MLVYSLSHILLHIPTEDQGHTLRLRHLKESDGELWVKYRLEDQDTLESVEPTSSLKWEYANGPQGWEPFFNFVENQRKNNQGISLAIEVGGEFIGVMSAYDFRAGASMPGRVGYWISTRFAGNGYTTAALALMTMYLTDEVNLHRIEATTLLDNVASQKVLEKVGFVKEGIQREVLFVGGKWQDHFAYAILQNDAKTAPAVFNLGYGIEIET